MISKYPIPTAALASLLFVILAYLVSPHVFVAVIFISFVLVTTLMSYFFDTRTTLVWMVLAVLGILFIPAVAALPLNELFIRFGFNVLNAAIIVYIQHRLKEAKSQTDFAQERLSYVAAAVDDIVVTLNPQGDIIYVSDSITDKLGYEKEELIGEEVFKLFPEEIAEPYKAWFKDYQAKGEYMSLNGKRYNTNLIRKDGSRFPVEYTVREFIDLQKRGFFTAVFNDISERVEAEELIKLQKERLEVVADSITDSLITIDAESTITFANPSVNVMFGYEAEELVGSNLTIIMPERLREAHRRGFSRYLASGERKLDWAAVEAIGLRRDGSEMPIEISFGEYRDGEKIFFSAVIRDISARKNAEEKLKESEERYKAFIANSEDGIWRFELGQPFPIDLTVNEQIDWIYDYGYIGECNDSMARMNGYVAASDIVGKPLKELFPRDENNGLYLETFIAKSYVVSNLESRETDREGEEVYYLNNLTGVVEDNKLLRLWGIKRNITEIKKYGNERERLLSEAREAKDAAERSNLEKDRFLANLSHELRTPLVSILGYSSMLLEDTTLEESDKNDMMRVIYKNAQLQVDLIEDLLDLSRIIAGKIQINRSFFDVKEVFDHSLAMLQQQIDAKELKIVKDYDHYTFYGDKKRFQQIFTNLLSNAVKFTDSGFIKVGSSVEEGNLVFCIKDSGTGISPENIPHLFKEFGQIDKSSTRNKGGLGLGLSIVKNLSALHEGSVSVDSFLGRGSTFTVTLPIVKTPEEEEIIKPVPALADFNGISILLTEDEVDSADFLKFFYERQGAKVDWASSAASARAFISRNKYDVYVFDLAMPVEDGISLIASLRAAGDDTPAVALTAFVDTYYEQKALAAGFNKFLKKPSSFPDLLSIMQVIKK